MLGYNGKLKTRITFTICKNLTHKIYIKKLNCIIHKKDMILNTVKVTKIETINSQLFDIATFVFLFEMK